MSSPKSKTPASQPKSASRPFRDYNPMLVNPRKEQFEPTPADPVRQHYRMAGGT